MHDQLLELLFTLGKDRYAIFKDFMKEYNRWYPGKPPINPTKRHSGKRFASLDGPFGRCHFHTHAKGEVCHLKSEDALAKADEDSGDEAYDSDAELDKAWAREMAGKA